MTNTKRKNISQPDDWWKAFEEQAKKEGYTLSSWMAACCMANLPRHVQNALTDRPPAHRPRQEPDS